MFPRLDPDQFYGQYIRFNDDARAGDKTKYRPPDPDVTSDYNEHWPHLQDDSAFWENDVMAKHLPGQHDQRDHKKGYKKLKSRHSRQLWVPDIDGGHFVPVQKKEFKEVLHPRDREGKFTDKPGGGTTRRLARAARQFTQGQTVVHLHDGKGNALSKTSSGDAGEALFASKGAQMVADHLKVKGYLQNAGGEKRRNTPLDFIIGTQKGKKQKRYAAEVKTTSANASGGKPKVSIRKWEKDKKTGELIPGSYFKKLEAIDLDDQMNPGYPKATPLLVGQVVTQNPDGSGTVRVVIFDGDYPSIKFDSMTEVGSYDFTLDEWQEAVATGKANAAKKGLSKADKSEKLVDDWDEEINPGDWYIDFGFTPARLVKVPEPKSGVKKGEERNLVSMLPQEIKKMRPQVLTDLDAEVAEIEKEWLELEKRRPKLGTGARFRALQGQLAARGATNPGALAAWIGRKKYGKQKFAALGGKKRRRRMRKDDFKFTELMQDDE